MIGLVALAAPASCLEHLHARSDAAGGRDAVLLPCRGMIVPVGTITLTKKC